MSGLCDDPRASRSGALAAELRELRAGLCRLPQAGAMVVSNGGIPKSWLVYNDLVVSPQMLFDAFFVA